MIPSVTIPAEQMMKMISINELAFLNGTPADISSEKTRNNNAEITMDRIHKNLDIVFS